MKEKTREEVKAMTKEDAMTYISSLVYEASKVIETLENCGKCRGNGHHARQKVADFAAKEIEDRWLDSEDL